MRRSRNHANAFKHGVFAQIFFLDWEDPREFWNLHNALVDEWKPVGPTEHDAVFSIAKATWRKRRMQYFMGSQRMRVTTDPNHQAYDEALTLQAFSDCIESQPDAFDRVLTKLPPDTADNLRRRFPRANFESISEWVHAIQEEISSVLLPEAKRFVDFAEMVCRDEGFFTLEVINDELAVEDRIDAMITRAVKRLVQTKAMKQMLGTTSENRGSDRPKKLLSNKPDESVEIVTKKQNGRRSDGTRKTGTMRTLETNRKNSKPGGSM